MFILSLLLINTAPYFIDSFHFNFFSTRSKSLFGSPLLISNGLDPSLSDLLSQIKHVESLTDLGAFNSQHNHHQTPDNKLKNQEQEEEIAPLMKDIQLLSSMLGEVIQREQDEDIYRFHQQFCTYAIERANGDQEALGQMIACAKSMSGEQLLGVVRAFTETLNLVNAAEVHHRTRLLRQADKISGRTSPFPIREDSIGGTIEKILQEKSVSKSDRDADQVKQEIYEKLLQQKVDIVLTAHPTEVNRRTLLRKYRVISELLGQKDRVDATAYETHSILIALRREIASIWGTDEIRRQKPTVQQEARGGVAILESVLWDAVPTFLRRFDHQLQASLQRSLPLTSTGPIRFSSWMGGDRDGNPFVTASVTKQVIFTQRLQAAKLFLQDIQLLYSELAICRGFSIEVMALARAVEHSFDRRELYRRILGRVKERLVATIDYCERELSLLAATSTSDNSSRKQGEDRQRRLKPQHQAVEQSQSSAAMSSSTLDLGELILDDRSLQRLQLDNLPDLSKVIGQSHQSFLQEAELLSILQIIYDSLDQSGYQEVAQGLLIDTIRRLQVFGLSLAPIDIREESTRHLQAMDAITQYLELGSYAQWSETEKITWLMQELQNKRPFLSASVSPSMIVGGEEETNKKVITTLNTFIMLGELSAMLVASSSLGAYVISQCKAASDVLCVMLLQKEFIGTTQSHPLLRVVPLFETLNDLTHAKDVLQTLFSLPGYTTQLLQDQQQEVMVGYSDSAKDAGRLAASWMQYRSQEEMVRIAAQHDVKLTFFHGKGGTVGRGGNPALYRAVLAHPPGTINGRFRVTEQGEMITQNFGSLSVAERTLDIYTAAVLAEQFTQHVTPQPIWCEYMEALSDHSCQAYRSILSSSDFLQYFSKVTPEKELGALNIGSRPAKRVASGGIESMRAIPWSFAWTQIRLHFPAWMGVGDALCSHEGECEQSSDQKHNKLPSIAALQEMYQHWPFFRELIDLIAMILSKTDYSISYNYDLQLLPSTDNDKSNNSPLYAMGEFIREKLVQTRKGILQVTQCDDLSSGFLLLQWSMRVRYPFVDPLNVLQAEIMSRLRQQGTEEKKDDERTDRPNSHEKQVLEDALIVSINGIAQGMKNSG